MTEVSRRRRSRVRTAAVLSVLVALVVAALAYDVHQRAVLGKARGDLTIVRHRLQSSTTQLHTTASSVVGVRSQLATTQANTAATLGKLATAKQQVSGAMGALSSQQVDIATLHGCLTGVQQATTQVAVGNLQAAVNAMTGASASCLALDAAQSGSGLAYPFDFPDPFILTVGNQYYAYATNSAAGNIQIIESPDLTHWTTLGDALPHEASWAQPGATWAPSVIKLGASYVLYYSAVYLATGAQCVSAAVATQPAGPFIDTSTIPVACQLSLGGSIDASPYVDAAGTPYLTWKSEGTATQPPTLWAQQLGPDGTGLVAGDPTALLQPSAAWQGGIIEAPDMVTIAGQYYLFYSGNNWSSPNYAEGVVACVGPLGPCPATSPPTMVASQAAFSGPGGASVFVDAQGTLRIAFAAWLPGKVGYPHSRVLFIRQLAIVNGTPQLS
jgi:hypothetical protein